MNNTENIKKELGKIIYGLDTSSTNSYTYEGIRNIIKILEIKPNDIFVFEGFQECVLINSDTERYGSVDDIQEAINDHTQGLED